MSFTDTLNKLTNDLKIVELDDYILIKFFKNMLLVNKKKKVVDYLNNKFDFYKLSKKRFYKIVKKGETPFNYLEAYGEFSFIFDSFFDFFDKVEISLSSLSDFLILKVWKLSITDKFISIQITPNKELFVNSKGSKKKHLKLKEGVDIEVFSKELIETVRDCLIHS